MERTLVVVKPDAVRAGNVGEIVFRFERSGLLVVAARMETFDTSMVKKLYGQHEKKDFYPRNAEFMMSGPSLVVILEGENAISTARRIVGSLDTPGTLRGDYGSENPRNAVHASDSIAAADLEIHRFFPGLQPTAGGLQ